MLAYADPSVQTPLMAGDTYSAGEAARVLRVSERRVRQLVDDGHLRAEQEKPLRISARSVIEERKRREKKPKSESPAAAGLEAGQLRELVTAVISDLLPLALEGQRRVEDMLREELAASRAETQQLRAELDAATAAGTAEKPKKGKGKKGKGKGKKGRKLLGFGK